MCSTFWYKQAICFAEWSQKDNDFGSRMSCLLYLNQLLACKGITVTRRVVNAGKVLDHFCRNWEDKEFCEKVRKSFSNGEYSRLNDELFHWVANFIDASELNYDMHTLHQWCIDCGNVYLTLSSDLSWTGRYRLCAYSNSLVPYMCKYLSICDLDKCETVEDLLHTMYETLYPE